MQKDDLAKILLFGVTALYWFSLYTYVPILAPYARHLGASYGMVGVIIGSYGLTQLLLRIPIGVISDAWGRRRLFVFGGICLAIFSALGMWLFASVTALLIFRAVSGIAASAWVDYTVLYVSYFPAGDMTRAIGYINAANALGQVAGMLAGGYVAQYAGLTSTFLLGAIGGGAGAVLALGVKEKYTAPKRVSTGPLAEVLRDRNLLRISVLGILLQIVIFVTVFGFSPVIAKTLGAGNFELGLLSILCIVPSIVSAALSGTFFIRYFSERSILGGGFFFLAAACLAIPFFQWLPLLYLSQAIIGFCLGLIMPLLMGMSIRYFPDEKRSTAMGIFQAVYGLGMFLGPVLAGTVSSRFGLNWGFWVTGLTGLAGAILVLWPDYLLLNRNVPGRLAPSGD